MDNKFRFEIDPKRGLVRITMAGFYTDQEIGEFLAARAAAHRALNWPPHAHVTLADVREMNVQPQQTVRAFQQMLGAPEYRSRRLAFVVSRSLARAQLGRALIGRDAAMFTELDQAEHYLFGDQKMIEPPRHAA